MKFTGRAVVAAVAAGAVAAPALAQTTGPVATYWVSASTSTGMNLGMMGRGGQMGAQQGGYQGQQQQAQQQQQKPKPKRPGLGSMLGAVAGGMVPGGGILGGLGGNRDNDNGSNGGSSNGGGGDNDAQRQAAMRQAMGMGGGGTTRTLSLELGSADKATGDPSAEHLIPAGLNMGQSLPLVTPREVKAEYEPTEGMPQGMEHPKGKMMIYWGCGEHAAGPPIVIDFATMGQGGKMPVFPNVAVNMPRPPSASRSATYGSWPNEKDSQAVPADGSLVGAHTVRGDYSPEIHFDLDQNHDFMAPLNVTSQTATPAGGTDVSWNSVAGATGYFAWMMGASMKDGRDNPTMIFWSSSMKASAFGAMMDYLPPSEVRRLIAQQVVMSPDVTHCIVPSEVRQAGAMGMYQMIAYGDEVNVGDPAKPKSPKTPWHLKYLVKVRYKSTTSTIMGMPGMGGDD